MKTIELIRQAVARGWCHEQNKFKDLDVDLVNAIADEVSEYIEDSRPSEMLIERYRHVLAVARNVLAVARVVQKCSPDVRIFHALKAYDDFQMTINEGEK